MAVLYFLSRKTFTIRSIGYSNEDEEFEEHHGCGVLEHTSAMHGGPEYCMISHPQTCELEAATVSKLDSAQIHLRVANHRQDAWHTLGDAEIPQHLSGICPAKVALGKIIVIHPEKEDNLKSQAFDESYEGTLRRLQQVAETTVCRARLVPDSRLNSQ